MKKITDLARHLSGFFTDFLPATRNLSRNTIKAYRDTFRLLLVFFREVHAIPPEKLIIKKMNDKLIIQYLDWLQKERKCTNSTRNQRLAAIHTFFRYLQLQEPEKLMLCQKILTIPFKKIPKGNHNTSYRRTDKAIIGTAGYTKKKRKKGYGIDECFI